MIHTLELTNYRGFEHYKLSNLARVNLLVGKNNSGKTSILEAVQLLASGGNARELGNLARRRGELISASPDPTAGQMRVYPDVTNFFHGRAFEEGASFSLETDGELGSMTAQVVRIDPGRSPIKGDDYKFHEVIVMSGMNLVSDYSNPRTPETGQRTAVPVTEGGGISFEVPEPPGRTDHLKAANRPVLLVPENSLDRRLMGELWDRALAEGQDQEVTEAMQILDPKISNIVFQSIDPSFGREPRSGILVGFEGERRRYPLGSHGEGMRRLLVMALALATTKGGVLLIDEVDTGLHYSILGDVWLLIVEAAKRLNIQVFLTTHSYDCVRALAWLCQTRPDLGPEVSIQKIERKLDRSVSLDAKQIQIAIEQDIEVR